MLLRRLEIEALRFDLNEDCEGARDEEVVLSGDGPLEDLALEGEEVRDSDAVGVELELISRGSIASSSAFGSSAMGSDSSGCSEDISMLRGVDVEGSRRRSYRRLISGVEGILHEIPDTLSGASDGMDSLDVDLDGAPTLSSLV